KIILLASKSIVLVGTLEKYQFLILMIPKVFLICGLVMIENVLLSLGSNTLVSYSPELTLNMESI
uniref:hypothetical protein n=1 Tax=Leptospira weilii TaxID=28184 RepID=UPI00056C2592